jgi:integrase
VPRTRLTELTVARAKSPKEGRLELWDTTLPAFGLRLTASGRRSWIAAIRKPGAQHPVRVKLGEPPLMSLATARDKARAMLQDPGGMIEQHERAKLETVQAMLEQFIERHHKPRNRRWQEVRQILLRELADWQHRPIRDIGRRDVLEVLDRAIDRGTPYAANRLLAYVRKMFNWCLERGIVDTSPVANIKAPAKERSRDRVLEDEELASIWNACDGLGWPWRDLVRLLIVTGQRRDEVAHMAWPDLDLERRLWMLPRELTKADRAHEVALSELAVEILAGMPRLSNGLVFPANRHGSRNPVSGFSGMKRRLDKLCGVVGWRLHDLRRTAASGMARLGHPPHVVTAILNHSPGSTMGITAVYNRHRYADEKRAALDAWSREVERIIGRNEAEVIALRSGHK